MVSGDSSHPIGSPHSHRVIVDHETYMTTDPSKSEHAVMEERVRRIAFLRMSAPPANALGYRLRKDLVERLNAAEVSADVDAIVIAGSGRGFSAGADISEFGT